jgi:S1-C subfamily serine protease
MAQETSPGVLASLSSELAAVVETVGPSVVRVDDGSRLTATGIVWTADGLIVTTSHGVERDDNLVVERADGTRHPATLVGRDPDTDLAVLRVQASGLPAVQRAEAAEVRVGALALALGRPGSSGLQATLGIISARIETERDQKIGYVLHTDAVLYPGFSGGALATMSGHVAGMTNLVFGRGKGVAVGTTIVEQVTEALLAHGRIPRGYLGIRTQSVALPDALRSVLSTPQERALLLIQVESGTPAEQAGLLLGDTLLRVNDRPVHDGDELRRYLRSLQVGQSVNLQILRGGELRDLSVTLGAGE